LTAQHNPTQTELDELVRQHKADKLRGPRYYSGKEDILYFCRDQARLLQVDNGRIELTEKGQELYGFLHTPEFGIRLFHWLVEASKERFSYFYKVYQALEAQAREGNLEIPVSAFNSILAETNKVSAKEIRRLLLDCGAVRQQDDSLILEPVFFSIDVRQRELNRLLSAISKMLTEEGRLIYPDTRARLRDLYPSIDLENLEGDLRARLRLNSTRAVEYIDGIRGSAQGA
jgi:hypothetical protein